MRHARVMLAACALVLAGPVAAQSCPDSVGVDLPTARPHEVGMDAARLAMLLRTLRTTDRAIHGLVVLRDCRVVLEHYAERVTRARNHAVYSVTKSVVGLLAVAALDEGRLAGFDTPVAALVARPPGLADAAWDQAGRITLRHVMQMASGLAYRHDPLGHPIYRAPDRLLVALAAPVTAAPGARFAYSDADATIAGAAIAASAGTDLHRFARRTLFGPLHMVGDEWPGRDAAGRLPGGWALRLRPMDMAKLGQLVLQRGNWNGRQVLRAEPLDELLRPSPAAPFYTAFWWRDARGESVEADWPVLSAVGFKGQRIFILRATRLVIVVTASLEDADQRIVFASLTRLARAAVVADHVLPADAAGQALLDEEARHPFDGRIASPDLPQDAPRLPAPR